MGVINGFTWLMKTICRKRSSFLFIFIFVYTYIKLYNMFYMFSFFILLSEIRSVYKNYSNQ